MVSKNPLNSMEAIKKLSSSDEEGKEEVKSLFDYEENKKHKRDSFVPSAPTENGKKKNFFGTPDSKVKKATFPTAPTGFNF